MTKPFPTPKPEINALIKALKEEGLKRQQLIEKQKLERKFKNEKRHETQFQPSTKS